MSKAEQDNGGPAADATSKIKAEVKTHTRKPTVFDAVAGRVTRHGLTRAAPPATTGDKVSTRPVLTPDEALYRHKNGPIRDETADMYWASRDLAPGTLPNSDLLKLLHEYASDFLAARGSKAYRTLDGTALLAVGILIEEIINGIGEIRNVLVEEPEEKASSQKEDSTSEPDLEEGQRNEKKKLPKKRNSKGKGKLVHGKRKRKRKSRNSHVTTPESAFTE